MSETKISVLACRPVEWTESYSALLLELPEPPIYPGSITKHCELCETPIYVGPKQQELLEEMHPVCFMCAAAVLDAHGQTVDDAQITDLGNEYRRQE